MKTTKFVLRCLVSACWLSGVLNVPIRSQPPGKPPTLYYDDVVKVAAGFDEVIVWEGLPGPFEKARKLELAKPTHFEIGDQSFYNLPLPFRPTEQAAVSRAILETKSNFKAWSGFKFCGGFHADYAIEWRKGGKTLAQALVCFTCHEGQFRVGKDEEQVDLSDSGFTALHALLWPHHSGRPRKGDAQVQPPTVEEPYRADRQPMGPPTPEPPPMPAAK